jgi:DNA-binding IclR family transcriptional regulator
VKSQSSDRLMSIIESFLVLPHQTLSEVASACELEPPTAIRYLRQLVDRGWLERDERSKSYTLGVALVTLGEAAQAAQPIRIRALPYMREVLRQFDETVNIAIRHRGEVVVVEALEGRQSIRRGATVGEKDEWFVSSLGKSILAHSPEKEVLELLELHPPIRRTKNTLMSKEEIFADLANIRLRGYALDDEESEIGLKCVGVPIWGGTNHVSYAISVSGPTQRIESRLPEIIPTLKEAAAAISLANKGSQ